ncbi:MAG: hypothetical protein EA357_08305 [Micavibrio sp.]|nr:MAG: hypothetical protein EA357_08305 [Micavibrio sp.]
MDHLDLCKELEPYLPKPVWDRALRDGYNYGWHIDDVPDVIEAIRKAGMASLFFSLLVFIPEDIGGGMCDCCIPQCSTYPEIFQQDIPWPDLVEKTAEAAQTSFERLKTECDFLEKGRKSAGHILAALGKPDADIENMLGFHISFCDSPPHRNIPESTGDRKLHEDFFELFLRKDIQAARDFVRPLAEQGNPVAQMCMAHTYARFDDVEPDVEEQLKWYRKAAEQNHAQAWYMLHMEYMWGIRVEKDLSEAARCLRKAAEQGHGMACSFLGDWYREGKGVKQDNAEAFKWLQRAATYGRPESQGELGQMYLWGAAVERNYEEAYFWLSLAVQSPWNCIYLPKRFEASKHLTPEQIEAVKQRIAEWKPEPKPQESNSPYFPTE